MPALAYLYLLIMLDKDSFTFSVQSSTSKILFTIEICFTKELLQSLKLLFLGIKKLIWLYYFLQFVYKRIICVSYKWIQLFRYLMLQWFCFAELGDTYCLFN